MVDKIDDTATTRIGFQRAMDMLEDGEADAVIVVAVMNSGKSVRLWTAGEQEFQDTIRDKLVSGLYAMKPTKDDQE